jgi:hypothetical protein
MKRPMVAFLTQLLLAIRSRLARLEAENPQSLPKISSELESEPPQELILNWGER